jgi:hypothetical protein
MIVEKGVASGARFERQFATQLDDMSSKMDHHKRAKAFWFRVAIAMSLPVYTRYCRILRTLTLTIYYQLVPLQIE